MGLKCHSSLPDPPDHWPYLTLLYPAWTCPSWHALPSRCPHNPYLVLPQAQREQERERGRRGWGGYNLWFWWGLLWCGGQLWLVNQDFFLRDACVRVCVWERERERECVCVRKKEREKPSELKRGQKQNISFVSSPWGNNTRMRLLHNVCDVGGKALRFAQQ